MLSETSCLISMSIVMAVIKRIRPFHAITKVPWILDTSTVQMVSINKGINEAHYQNAVLEASQEHLDDQVM